MYTFQGKGEEEEVGKGVWELRNFFAREIDYLPLLKWIGFVDWLVGDFYKTAISSVVILGFRD